MYCNASDYLQFSGIFAILQFAFIFPPSFPNTSNLFAFIPAHRRFRQDGGTAAVIGALWDL